VTFVRRRLGHLIVVSGLAAIMILPGLSSPANAVLRPATAGPPPTAPAPSAIDRFGACVAGQHTGDVLLLIDQSGSLQQTDPHAARVTAATYLVDQLESSAAANHQTIDVSVAGFADTYVPTLPWSQLTSASIPKINAAIAGFTNKNTGFDTDYWSALDGAQEALRAHAASLGETTRCQAIVLLTDGMIDISPRTTTTLQQEFGTTKPYSGSLKLTTPAAAQTAQNEAVNDICRSGGLADQIRAAGIETFAVGLSPPVTASTPQQNFGLLDSIATGEANGPSPNPTHCGRTLTPSPGMFYTASGIDQLLFAFDSLSSPGQPPISQKTHVCQRKLCPQDAHSFTLDGSIDSVRILATSPVAHPEVYLQGPGNWKSTLTDHGSQLAQTVIHDDLRISYEWYSGQTLEIKMSAPPGAPSWPGKWSVTFVDPTGTSATAIAQSNIHISGDVYPTWLRQAAEMLRHGTRTTIRLGLVTAGGTPIEPSALLGSIRLQATLLPSAGQPALLATGLTKQTLRDPIGVDLDSIPVGPATLRLTLNITTAPVMGPHGKTLVPGTPLTPESVALPVTIAPPLDYPTVTTSLNFGTIQGPAHSIASISVRGPGCVWVSGIAHVVTGPQDVIKTATLTSPEDTASHCLRVKNGQRLHLPVRLTTHASGIGALTGSFALTESPSLHGQTLTVQATFAANMEKSLNSFHFLLALIATLILGPGIPLLVLYVMKWLSAKIPSAPICAEMIAVSVTSTRILRDGEEFELRDSDLVRNLLPIGRGGSRSVQTGGVTLRTHIGLLPTGQGYVTVESPGQLGISSAKDPGPTRTGHARLPLIVQDHWVLLQDPTGPPEAATVMILARADAPSATKNQLTSDLLLRGPNLLTELRSMRATAGSTESPPRQPDVEADLYG
jgi:hypothetical protein